MKEPSFKQEQQYWQANIKFVAGLDEAGMGALAGPVVAGAVIIPQDLNDQFPMSNVQIRDSKTLSAKQREKAEIWIKDNAVSWAIGEASVAEITKINIRNAAHLAMRRAVDSLKQVPEVLLVDGNPAQPHPVIPAVNIIGGDSVSFSIAAASILAKVHRDNLMQEIDKEFPLYSLAQHKGYGSAAHMAALQEHGASEHHRPTFAPVAAVS